MRKPIKIIFSGIALVGLSAVFQNCSDVQFKTQNSNVCLEGESCSNEETPLADNRCYQQTYKQPEITTNNNALDILIVTDTSGSLVEERREVAEGVSLLLRQLPNNADVNMSIMLAHGDKTAYGGNLFAQRSYEKVFKAKDKSKDQINNYIIQNLGQSLPGDYDTDGGEVLLYSLYKSLFTNYQKIQSEGFYRDYANLVILMITDENDICSLGSYPRPERLQPVYDPERKELQAYQKYCLNGNQQLMVTPESIKNGFADLKNGSKVFVHSISYLDPKLIPNVGENEIGYGVIDLVDLTGGVKVDMGKATKDNNYIHSELSKIGELTQQQLGYLKTQFDLSSGESINAQSIRVFIDGKANFDYQYDSSTKSIKLLSPGSSGSKVEVNYCNL